VILHQRMLRDAGCGIAMATVPRLPLHRDHHRRRNREIVTPSSAHAQQHRVECPPQAPADWDLTKSAPLDQVAVLSQPGGTPIDERSPPSLLPDRGFARDEVWHNIWLLGNEPGWSHFVDCRYRGSPRILRLNADRLRQCEQTARPYSAKGGVADNAVQTMKCD
jgi:hypothetical protein